MEKETFSVVLGFELVALRLYSYNLSHVPGPLEKETFWKIVSRVS
jgi:hypothetical protein